MAPPHHFPDMMRTMRNLAGLNQKQMAAQLHISPTYLHDLEHGRRKPTIKLVDRICKFLNADHSTALFWRIAAARALGWRV